MMLDTFLLQIVFELGGCIFTSIVGSQLLHFVARRLLDRGLPFDELPENFMLVLYHIDPHIVCLVVYEYYEVLGLTK